VKIYISGLYCGPNPSAGVGVARSLRLAYPDATLIGVDYSNRSSGIHSPDFDDVWIQQPWDRLDLDAHAASIRDRLEQQASYWISCLDLEILWMAQALVPHPRLLIPSHEALDQIAKPAVPAHRGLPVEIPPFVSTIEQDWALHSFCRRHGWRIWLKGPYYDAVGVNSWPSFMSLRAAFESTWATEKLFLQAHVRGLEESVSFSAYRGRLLDAVHMVKRDITPEGKTWGGHVDDPAPELLNPLREIVSALNWTGGAELEMIRNPAGELWLIEMNPRFPAWIHGATVAGRNLVGRLVEAASGIAMCKAERQSSEFARIVLEVPVRSRYPLPPLQEPLTGSHHPAAKYPSGMPMLAHRLDELRRRVAPPDASAPVQPSPTVPASFIEDMRGADLDHVQTPFRLLLPRTASRSFSQLAAAARTASCPGCEVRVAYSIKTNPDERFIGLARDAGFLAEAISELEVAKALALGFLPGQVILNGPAKGWPSPIRAHPIHAIFCDSIEELRQIVQRAARGEDLAEIIGVRLRGPQTISRFGIPIASHEIFNEMIELLRALPRAFRLGCHFHIASNFFGVEQWWRLYDSSLRCAKAIESCADRTVECVDIGGGWFPDDFENDLVPKLGSAVRQARKALASLHEFVLEPGKAMVQHSMAVAVRVLEVRRHRGLPEEIVVDGSIAELPLASQYPHRILQRDYKTGEWQPMARGKARILGRLCMEDDILAPNVHPRADIAEGELLAICDAGAYESSMAYTFGRGKTNGL
jgi:diaminopimelate decarboxylase